MLCSLADDQELPSSVPKAAYQMALRLAANLAALLDLALKQLATEAESFRIATAPPRTDRYPRFKERKARRPTGGRPALLSDGGEILLKVLELAKTHARSSGREGSISRRELLRPLALHLAAEEKKRGNRRRLDELTCQHLKKLENQYQAARLAHPKYAREIERM